MEKDAFYFPHFSNARTDRKLRRVRKELGIEGYGIYFMLLEVLRDQDGFKYPLGDMDLLADDFGTSEQKVRTVVCNYELFQTIDNCFFSTRFNEFLNPYIEGKQVSKVNGIKGNLIRYGYLTKEAANEMTHIEILAFNANKPILIGGESGGESECDRKESKVNKEKETNETKESKLENPFSEIFLPIWEQWKEYKKSQHKFTYKAVTTEQAALTELLKKSKGSEQTAIEIVHQSIANGWKGFFELKDTLGKGTFSTNR